MEKLKVNFVDFWSGFDKVNNDFYRILSEKYEIEISDKPDYLFYSVFGYEHTKYDCVRIFFTGECIAPDFNICDYAIGFDNITFGDRYIRVPLYRLFQYKKDFEKALNKHLISDEEIKNKKAFCNFVYSNCSAQKSRENFFELLNSYKKVDSGGRYLNNIGGPVADKYEFQKQYKFSIAFENCCHIGYTTEKIVQAFSAGTVPIYFGNSEISKEFNSEAFINVHNFSSMEEVIKKIEEIDSNDELFCKMLRAPIGGSMDESDLKNFLFNIVSQPYNKAHRRPTNTTVGDREHQQHIIRKIKFLTKPFVRMRNLFIKIKKGVIIKR